MVNGEPLVNEATAARVSDAVQRLGYRPNELAHSLKGQRSRTIGLIVDKEAPEAASLQPLHALDAVVSPSGTKAKKRAT